MTAKSSHQTAWTSLHWTLPILALLCSGVAAHAQSSSGIEAASGQYSLGTKVGDGTSQTLGGSCNSGHCRISGGTEKGNNLFHRLSKLRTNGNITKISLDNRKPANQSSTYASIILSNIDSNGTYINTPFNLDAAKSDLIILSPGGIEIGGLATFTNIDSLALSTAENLTIGSETFHYQDSTTEDLINMTAVIDLAQSIFSDNQTSGGQISIKIDDVLSIDADLLLHSVGGIDIDLDSANSAGSLEIGGALDIKAKGLPSSNTAPTNAIQIGPITAEANSITIAADGGSNQPQAIAITGATIVADGTITMTGHSGDETSSIDHDDLRGVVIDYVDIYSNNGDITITGTAGDGNQQYNSNATGDFYDVLYGSGISITNSSWLEATNGTITLNGEGSTALELFGSHGIEIDSSDLIAQSIVADGVGAKAYLDGWIDESHGLHLSNASITSTQGTTLTGQAGNTLSTEADLGIIIGINSESSNLTTSAGRITLDGTGGSGQSLSISSGTVLLDSDLRASSIKILGTGGSSALLDNSDTSIGIAITESNTLDTNSSNDALTSIIHSDQTEEQNGDIILIGQGGSALNDSGGIWSEASMDSAGSIQLEGTGGTGYKDIYGISLEGTVIARDAFTIPTSTTTILKAEDDITLTGIGGKGVEIVDSNGTYLYGVDLQASTGIHLKGEAGSSSGISSADGMLDGVYVEDSLLNVSGSEGLTNIDNPHNANLLIKGIPGSSQLSVEESAGVIIKTSNIGSNGNVFIQGDGRNTSSAILKYGNGIYTDTSELKGSSLILEGYGAAATEPNAIDANGQLIDQKSLGVEINNSEVTTSSSDPLVEQSIIIRGTGSVGNIDINGVDIYESTLSSDGVIEITGDGGDAATAITDGVGVSVISSVVTGHMVELDGTGSTGTTTTGSSGIWMQNTTITGTASVAMTGQAGQTTSLNGASTANDGISMLDSSIIQSDGLIQLSGNGGESAGSSKSSYGIWVDGSSIKTAASLEMTGQGGSGREIGNANGISLSSSYDDDSGELIALTDVTTGQDLTITGFGGSGTVSATQTRGVVVDSITVSSGGLININGTGGTSEQSSNVSDSNQGIYLGESSLNSTAGTITLVGTGGNGGELITGIELYDATLTSLGDIKLNGTGGEGDIVTMAEGIWAINLTLDTAEGVIDIDGTGGTANTIEAGYGVELVDSLVKLSDQKTLTMDGDGATATNQIDSLNNAGIKLSNTSMIGGSSVDLVGNGGDGGLNNTGIELLGTQLIAKQGTISLTGTGGAGTNIKKAIGVRIESIDLEDTTSTSQLQQSELKSKSITIKGDGGVSNLRKGAINSTGEDTFNQTANNVGIQIKNSTINSSAGTVSIVGTGGSLVVDDISSNNQESEIDVISRASNLEGVNLKNATTLSTGATYINGSAGRPVAGDENSGTTIIDSTITSATAASASQRNAAIDQLDNRIEGNAYSGTNSNYGLSIESTDIESTHQNLTLSGRGGLKATGEKNFGIYIGNQSSVKVGTKNNPQLLNIYGAGGDGTDMTGGILTQQTTYDVEGTIKMYGTSQGAGQFGNNSVEIYNDATISSSGDTSISGNNDVNISDATIESGGNTDINADNDVNINDSSIESGEETNITAGDTINIEDSSIESGEETNITAGDTINIEDSSIESGEETNIIAGNTITVAATQLNASHTLNLQAETVTTTDLQLNTPELRINSNETSSMTTQQSDLTVSLQQPIQSSVEQPLEPMSRSNEELTMSLSGNVNYFAEETEESTGQASTESDPDDEKSEMETTQESTEQNDQEMRSSSELSRTEIQQRHEQSEQENTNFVASSLGLKQKKAMTIEAIQKMLSTGKTIMNSIGK